MWERPFRLGILLAICLPGCHDSTNEALQPLPDLKGPAAVAPVIPELIHEQWPAPELADQILAIVGPNGELTDSCHPGEKVTIRYQFRVSKQSHPANIGFPEKSKRVVITLGKQTHKGIVSAGSSVSQFAKVSQGIYIAKVELQVPPNLKSSGPGWILQAKLLRDTPGQDPIITKEVPITLLDTVSKAPD